MLIKAGIHAGDLIYSGRPNALEMRSVIERWLFDPFIGMGYEAVQHEWGTTWNTGFIYSRGFPVSRMSGFLNFVSKNFPDQRVTLEINDPEQANRMAPVLAKAGFYPNHEELFLLHNGFIPEPSNGNRHLISVNESNLLQLARTRLASFSDHQESLDAEELNREFNLRRLELRGTGRGLLALENDSPVGFIWWHDDPENIWIPFLGTLTNQRGKGVASALLRACFLNNYTAGRKRIILNVLQHNTKALRLYTALGFNQEIYRLWRFRYDPTE